MGNPHRTRWAAIGAAVAVTLGGGGLIGVSASGIDGSSALVAIAPVRILDTRQDAKVSGATRLLQVTGPVRTFSGSSGTETVVPDGASSVAINLTVTEGVRNAGYGFVTAFPCTDASDPVPNASTLNFVEGADVANGVVVPLGAEGEICLHVFGAAHLLVDVSGYYTDGRLDDIEADIATNASDIATNAADIATNASGVATNAGDIATNASDIASNGSGIVDNGSQIARVAAGNFRGFVETPSAVGPSNSTAGIDIERGADGLPVMTRIASGGALTVTTCDDVGCVDEGEVSSVLDVGVVTDAALAIGADGMPVIAFRTATPELGVVVCTSFDCSTHRAPVILDDRAGTGETPDIAIGVGGNPVIAYTVAGAAVSTVTCVDPTCSSTGGRDQYWSDQVFGDVRDPSVAVGIRGNPFVVFQREFSANTETYAPEYELTILWCVAADCSSSATTSIRGSAGDVGTTTGYLPQVIQTIHPSAMDAAYFGWPDFFIVHGVSSPGGWSIEAVQFDIAEAPDVWAGESILSAPLSGALESLAVRIGADGTPVLGYAAEDAGAFQINYLVCAYEDCDPAASSPSVFSDLDECGSAGCGLSMAMSGGGLPMIAYHDATGSSAVANIYVPWWTVGGR